MATTTVELVQGLPRNRLIEKIHFHARQGDVHRRALAFYLVDLEWRGEARALGYTNAVHYARDALGLQERTARELLRVARALEELELLDQAIARAEISWSKLREVVRVATRETEAEWLEYARANSARRVELAVAKAKRGELPPRPDGLGAARARFRVQFSLSAAVNELWQSALGKVLDECGEGATLEDAIRRIGEIVLRGDDGDDGAGAAAGGNGGDGGESGERGSSESPSKRSSERKARELHTLPDGKSAVGESDTGPIPTPPETVDEVITGAPKGETETLAAQDRHPPGECSAIQSVERVLVPEHERDRPETWERRHATIVRDGERCMSCCAKKELVPHHIVSRTDGGESEKKAFVALCRRCRGLVYEGFVVLRVEADGRITSLDRFGRPLQRGEMTREILENSRSNDPLTIVERSCVAPSIEPATAAQPVAENGGLDYSTEPRSAEGPVAAAAYAGALETCESIASILSLDDLPREISAKEWREIQGAFDWSASRQAFVLRQESAGVIMIDAESRAPRGSLTRGGKRPDARPCGSALRPEVFDEVAGQQNVIESLQIALRAAAQRGEPLGHVLLSGPGGLGKTSIARILASETSKQFHSAIGGILTSPPAVVALLSGLEPFDVLFVDEIHALRRSVCEAFYTALEDRFVDVVLADGTRTRPLRIRLEPFTLVGATNELGDLPASFRARFTFQETLRLLEREELVRVVEGKCPTVGHRLGIGAADAIARRARGVPREALRLLGRARDVAELAGSETIELEHVERASELCEIDGNGLNEDDRRILHFLIERGRPVGLGVIAACLGIDEETVRRAHEPFLLRECLIDRTPRGRVATSIAREWLDVNGGSSGATGAGS